MFALLHHKSYLERVQEEKTHSSLGFPELPFEGWTLAEQGCECIRSENEGFLMNSVEVADVFFDALARPFRNQEPVACGDQQPWPGKEFGCEGWKVCWASDLEVVPVQVLCQHRLQMLDI